VIWPDLADLVVIADRTLGLGTDATLDLFDVTAAETALAEAHSGSDGGDPAGGAAALLHALLRHHPFRHGNTQIAVVVTLQFLTLNQWRADLDPPEAAGAVIADLAAGSLTTADFAAWLAPRLSPGSEPITQEAPMRGWMPGRRRPARRDLATGTSGRLTGRARRAVILAQDESRRLNHNYLGTEHILLGLIHEGDGVAARALESLGITLEAVRQQVEDIVGRGRQDPSGHIPFTPRARKVLELSLREAMQLDHLYVGTEHILLGLLREGEGLAIEILAKLGAQHDQLRGAVFRLLASHEPVRREPAQPPGFRDYEQKIAVVRHQKDAAIDAQDFDTAAAFRDREKQLLAERARRITEWSAGVDVVALGEELDRLHHEVARLQDLLLHHDIQPGDGNQQTG
jgi:Clp amino terminal domain, pathogenicity island component/Fic/DOC family